MEPVAEHMPKLRKLASRMANSIPRACRGPGLEFEDLLQIAAFAFWEAAKRYDADRGASLWTFASRRAWGAMRDFIRDSDWVPRLARQRGECPPRNLSLDAVARLDDSGREIEWVDMHPDSIATVDDRDEAAAVLKGMAPKHRLVFSLYNSDAANMKEIGRAMGLSESRVSQLHATAKAEVRDLAAAFVERQRELVA